MTINAVKGLAHCACIAAITLGFACRSIASLPEQKDLAFNKPASASSIENDDQSAAKANDGDEDTRWCADDEPENGAEWWQVDLQTPADLSGCQIIFPYEGTQYRYKVEGSADRKSWILLSDQSKNTVRTRVRNLRFKEVGGIRFVKITILGFDQGVWASISEVKIFGHSTTTGK